MIDIYLLEQIDAFKKIGTLRGAAEYLHMSQPTLTRSMQKIESILETPILDRQGNRVTLNDYGEIVADYARRILDEEKELVEKISNMKESMNTLSIGSVAPGPIYKLLPLSSRLFPGSPISSNISDEQSLIAALNQEKYGIVVLTHPLNDSKYICKKYITEHLYISINSMHPASSYSEISFSDMDGQNFIMFSQVGIWADIVKKEMPNSIFFEQSSIEAVNEITKYSNLPSFITNITMEVFPLRRENRIAVPLSDDSAKITFYIICLKKNLPKWNQLFENI